MTKNYQNHPKFDTVLNNVLGGEWWKQEFYEKKKERTLFSTDIEYISKKPLRLMDIESKFHEKLEEIFPFVAEKPIQLYTQGNKLLFSLFL